MAFFFLRFVHNRENKLMVVNSLKHHTLIILIHKISAKAKLISLGKMTYIYIKQN